jgi:hypothetical protein
MGAFFGYSFNYLFAFTHDLPPTLQEYAYQQGLAGATSGIIGGITGIVVPHIIIPVITNIRVVQSVINRLGSNRHSAYNNSMEE